jgi:hypothetical protein
MRTVAFIVIATALILVWVFANGAAHYISMTVTNIGKGQQFDPEPWILLNLVCIWCNRALPSAGARVRDWARSAGLPSAARASGRYCSMPAKRQSTSTPTA